MKLCYICNVESNDWVKLNGVKSAHTNAQIIDLLKKILSNLDIKRPMDNENNCICSECLDRIDEYDRSCAIVESKERELCDIFQKTETLHANKSSESKNEQNKKTGSGVDLLPEVQVGRGHSFQFRSTTIKKITVGTTQVESDPDGQSNAVIEIQSDDSSGHEYDMNDGSDDEYVPSKRMKSSVSTTLHSNSNTNIDDNEFVEKDEKAELWMKTIDRPYQPGTHECSELNCGQIFTRKLDLIAHQRWHKKQKKPQFSCDICSFVLHDQATFDTHRKLHENVSKFECVICKKVLSTRGNLTVHMRIHGAPNHICDICGKEFIHKTSFVAHMSFHINKRSFACPHCPMKFNIETNLKRHQQTHRQDKPFACKICGNRFGYIGNMKAHERLHSETDKTHECSFCNARFARRTKMLQHMEKHYSIPALCPMERDQHGSSQLQLSTVKSKFK